MRPLVSVILVNYNGYEDTVECVKSLLEITYDNYNIIVVDNGSTKTPSGEQLEFLKKNTYFVVSKENLGFSGGNNIGIKKAAETGTEYYLLLNNDTVVDANFLSVLVDVAESNSDAGIVCGKIRYYDEPDILWFAGGSFTPETGRTSHYKYNKKDDDLNEYVSEITFATGCMLLMPAAVVDKVGFLDERMFLYAEDTEYSCRVIQNGYKIYYCNHAVIYHKVSRSTGAASSNTQYYMVRNNLMIIRMYGTRKIAAYLERIFYWCKEAFRKRMSKEAVRCGLIDFFKGRIGKRKQ